MTADKLGNFSIDIECYNKIMELIPGGAILELGSGYATQMLSDWYKMYSIENNPKWLNRFKSTYIYAPIKDGWYDLDALKSLPDYDLILVDGPCASAANPSIRMGFYKNISLFNVDVPMVFDDVQRHPERELVENVSEYVDREYTIYGNKKKFAVI